MKIIDVSDKYTYQTSHLNGSVNIPYDELKGVSFIYSANDTPVSK